MSPAPTPHGPRLLVVVLLLELSLLSLPSGLPRRTAHAYIQSHSPNGQALHWSLPPSTPTSGAVRDGRITFVINERGSEDIDDGSEFEAIRQAFATWQGVASATVAFLDDGLTPRTRTFGGQTNLVVWREQGENSALGPGVFALTTSTFRSDGEVMGTEIELNGADFQWSTRGEAGRADVQHIVTHEIGHLLQLDHTFVAGATMHPSTFAGDLQSRSLEADDRAGVSTIYPAAGFGASTGRILGRVSKNGLPVFGAYITAVPVRPQEGGPGEVAGITFPSGDYEIAGLQPGSYRLRLNAVDRATLTGYFAGADQNLLAVTYPSTPVPAEGLVIGVQTGRLVTGINFSVTAGTDPDAFEPDNTFEQAREVPTNGVARTHNFSTEGDVDTVRFSGRAGTAYTIETSRLGPFADTIMELFDEQRLAVQHNDARADDLDTARGQLASRITFRAARSGDYFAQVRQWLPSAAQGGRFGGGYNYDLAISEAPPLVQGRVVSAASGLPLPNVLVRLGGLRATTDQEGNFFFLEGPRGAGSLEVSAPGFAAKQEPINTLLPVEVSVSLVPVLGSLAGRITNLVTGEPVTQASVALGTLRVRSNPDGNFLLAEAPAGEHEILVVADGFLAFRRSVLVVGGGGLVVNPQLLPAPPPGAEPATGAPQLRATLNRSSFRSGDDLLLTLHTLAGDAGRFDLYLVVQLPNGELRALRPAGGVLLDLLPFQADRGLQIGSELLFAHTFSGEEPAGGYRLVAGIVAVGADVLSPQVEIVSLAEAPFTFSP
ncbi:MAG: carboxypeptidase regulatory-like domain-containing protein [Candidatus Tectomicrobia bacterium]|nr:carboxypeptidase regulatory-like domain-containing protein [Candidatus Tectomicrobia bacterium]